MASKDIPKVADADKESQYGYVFGVSGPGEFSLLCNSRLVCFYGGVIGSR